MDAGAHADVHDVPVVIGEDAEALGEVGIVEQAPALVLGRVDGDLVGVDDEVEGLEALHDAEQMLAVLAHSRV